MTDEQKRLAKRMETAFSVLCKVTEEKEYAIAYDAYDAAAKAYGASMPIMRQWPFYEENAGSLPQLGE